MFNESGNGQGDDDGHRRTRLLLRSRGDPERGVDDAPDYRASAGLARGARSGFDPGGEYGGDFEDFHTQYAIGGGRDGSCSITTRKEFHA